MVRRSATSTVFSVQNSLARAVTQAPYRTPIEIYIKHTSMSYTRLSASELRRQCTGCRFANASSSNSAPSRSGLSILVSHAGYLASELHRNQQSRALRSGAATVLHRPHASSDFHRHSFAVSAPAVWNSISSAVRDSVSLNTFKTAFKTYLFNCAYTSRHWQWFIGTSDSLLVTYGADQTNPYDWLIDWLIRQTITLKHRRRRHRRPSDRRRIACLLYTSPEPTRPY